MKERSKLVRRMSTLRAARSAAHYAAHFGGVSPVQRFESCINLAISRFAARTSLCARGMGLSSSARAAVVPFEFAAPEPPPGRRASASAASHLLALAIIMRPSSF